MRPGSAVLQRCVVVVSAVAISLLAVLGEVLVRPIVNYELGWLVIDAAVTTVIAASAVAAAFFCVSMTPSVLMLSAALASTFSNLALGAQAASPWWAVLFALSGGTQVALIGLVIVFPSGRRRSRGARTLLTASLVVFTASMLSRLFMFDPQQWNWCDCLSNPLAFAADESLHLGAESVIGVAYAAVAVILLWFMIARSLRDQPGWRDIDLPMLVAGSITSIAWIVTDLQESVGIGWTGDGPVYLRSSTAVLIPLAFVSGLIVMRGLRARVADLALTTAESGRLRFESMLGASVGDETLRMLWWDRREAGYRDSAGRATTPRSVAGEYAREISSPHGPVAVVYRSGPALGRDDLRPVLDALAIAAENARLADELERTIDLVRESRARLVSAGDEARRRIERDLHDGAQQLMVSSAINLRLARDGAREHQDPALSAAIDRASDQLALALAELRELARGITPTVLSHGGIRSALEELALRSPVPVTVIAPEQIRLADLQGATVYFVVAECLTNIARHAAATTARVELTTAPALTLTVEDDGGGGAWFDGGTGLRGIADRIEATGGQLAIISPPGGGTRIVATFAGSGERSAS